MVDKEKDLALWLRHKCLIIMGYALRAYKWSGEEKFMEHAKWFGQLSAELKKEL